LLWRSKIPVLLLFDTQQPCGRISMQSSNIVVVGIARVAGVVLAVGAVVGDMDVGCAVVH
jgi:hypothetical protein